MPSSICRAMKATRAALFGRCPRTWRVALRHHSSWARKACCQKWIGHLLPGRIGKAPVAGVGLKRDAVAAGGERGKPRRGQPGLQRQFELPAGRPRQMRKPVEPGGSLRVG